MSDVSRRTFLAGAAALAAPSLVEARPVRSLRKPRAIRPGERIGLIAPASAGTPEDTDRACATIRQLGYEPVVGANTLRRFGYLAGTDEERAADFNGMVADRTIAMILCLRGGWGTPRILPLIDYDAFRRRAIPVMGYSDITGLLNGLTRRAGVITFHGPVALARFSEFDSGGFSAALARPEPLGVFPPGPGRNDPPSETFVSGRAEGRLVGGNLSLISALLGTPYAPDLRDALLFLEDIGEEAYRVDRMLTHLLLQPDARRIKGLIFGDFRLRSSQTDPTDPEGDFTMAQVLGERARAFGVPSFCGAAIGHIADQWTVPLGVRARMDADARTVEVLDAAVKA